MLADCIEWTGANNGRGYGRVWRCIDGARKKVYIHREMWEKHHGPIAPGLEIRHRCDNPKCYNIEHLEIGTHADNMRDMHERERRHYHRAVLCKNGHPFSVENTRWVKDSKYDGLYQQCRECTNAPRRKGGRLWKGK